MLSMLYFDTEDFISPPDSPVHQLPAQMAEIMTGLGFPGSFHIHGEKARYMERFGQRDVIEAISRHDVSLHFDRGSIPITTAEEVSHLGWADGVERTLVRELPGFQAIERLFGRCTALTQHGGNWAAQIVYAAGRMGRPFFGSPFRQPRRAVSWFANNLVIPGFQGRFWLDPYYRDDEAFERQVQHVDAYLAERAGSVDFAPMFACHPCRVLLDEFPDAVYFPQGRMPRVDERPVMRVADGVSVERVLKNFERLIRRLLDLPGIEWTDTAGVAERYAWRPVRVADQEVQHAAHAVVNNGGPTFTRHLTAAETLYLLARRRFQYADFYEVPSLLGPVAESKGGTELPVGADLDEIAIRILRACEETGHLPSTIHAGSIDMSPSAALALLACDVVGRAPVSIRKWDLTVDAIPGMVEAGDRVRMLYSKWTCFSPAFDNASIFRHFRLQAWTYKPAMLREDYPEGVVELGRGENPMIYSVWRDACAFGKMFDFPCCQGERGQQG